LTGDSDFSSRGEREERLIEQSCFKLWGMRTLLFLMRKDQPINQSINQTIL